MKRTSLLLLFLPAYVCAWATGDSLNYLLPSDTIIIYPDRASGHLVFDHQIEPGQTLYGLARHYGLPIEDFYYLNPSLRGSYDPGISAQIAIPSVALKPVIRVDSITYYSPVFWEFSAGQSIFGLVNRHLHWPSDEMIRYNNPGLDPANMKAGQRIFIGWLPVAGIPEDLQPEVIDPYVRQNQGLAEQWRQSTVGKSLQTASGKAAWTEEGDPGQFLALHRSARIGSLIEVLDKRTGKVLYCRVIGRIPGQIYDPNVEVVLSPLLVRAFGVRDRFFSVQVKFY
ncbi:MAG: LysM domain-containing protein [Bacteroidota bacterium]